MRLLSMLMPQERKFFALFNQHASLVVEGAAALVEMLDDYSDGSRRDEHVARLQQPRPFLLRHATGGMDAITKAVLCDRAIDDRIGVLRACGDRKGGECHRRDEVELCHM